MVVQEIVEKGYLLSILHFDNQRKQPVAILRKKESFEYSGLDVS